MQPLAGRGVPGAKTCLGSFISVCAPKRMGIPRMATNQCKAKLCDLDFVPVRVEGQDTQFPASPGVYAVYNEEQALQYVGISRKLSMSIAYHLRELPELAQQVKFQELPEGTRDSLTNAWKEWLQESFEECGNIPPGNAQGEDMWKPKRPERVKQELKLTPGKGIDDLLCSIEDLVKDVVTTQKVVAFIKGTRTQPQCGFSYQMLTALNREGVDYEVVNVLDETYNPGLREAIKNYSQWPTIPQLYINGEFVGGSDIVQEFSESGELAKVLNK